MPRLRRPRWPLALALVFAVIAGVFTYGWETQSGYYALWPDRAHAAEFYVKVPGGKPPAPGSGFYFVDVHVLQANLLEAEYFRHFVTGAQLIPARAELTPGESEHQREHEDVQMMADSQQVAQAVAERALGLHVKISGDGLFVDSVAPHYPAAKAGVQAGSQLTAIDGTPLQSLGDLRRATAGVQPGDTVRYTFRPGGARAIRTVAAPGTHDPVIGIGVAEQLRISHLSVPVRFLTQGIGGPSAGLAFTLEIYDALSGRHLLRGHRIAATGTIALNGAVGAIGGVTQKTLGVISAGADTFIVPREDGNYRDAVAAAHGRIRVIGVRSFAQALRDIRALPAVTNR